MFTIIFDQLPAEIEQKKKKKKEIPFLEGLSHILGEPKRLFAHGRWIQRA